MPKHPPQDRRSIDALVQIMSDLRDPNGGCPWDLEQTFETIAPYTLEEAYEVFDAIENKDMVALKDELGDLLFQVIYHAQMAAEAQQFTLADVVENVCDKMVRRHPHVFGNAEIDSPDAQTLNWEQIKAQERGEAGENSRTLDGVPLVLPALARAVKLQNRAARVGFDWPDKSDVLDKLNEEMLELSHEIASNTDKGRREDELGDLLFVYANLARHLKIDPENALRKTNTKFVNRFEYIEKSLEAEGKNPIDSTLEEMDALWNEAKTRV